jgi:four helix bundle protein
MRTKAEALQKRTTNFALRILKVYRALPNCAEARIIGQQLLRSGTSVAANYRAACRARSRAEFLYKLGVVEEEADESAFWLEFLADSGLVRRERLTELTSEARQITAIFVASRRTVKRNNRKSPIGNRKSSLVRRYD